MKQQADNYRFFLWFGCLRIIIYDTSPFAAVKSLLTVGLDFLTSVLPSPPTMVKGALPLTMSLGVLKSRILLSSKEIIPFWKLIYQGFFASSAL